jgi:hypothetical protein
MGNVEAGCCAANREKPKGKLKPGDMEKAIKNFQKDLLKEWKATNRNSHRFIYKKNLAGNIWPEIAWGFIQHQAGLNPNFKRAVEGLALRPNYRTVYDRKIMTVSELLTVLNTIQAMFIIDKGRFNGKNDTNILNLDSDVTLKFLANSEILTNFAMLNFEDFVLKQYGDTEKKWWKINAKIKDNLLKATSKTYPDCGSILSAKIEKFLKARDEDYPGVCIEFLNFLYWNKDDSTCIDEAYCQLLLSASRTTSYSDGQLTRIWRCLQLLARCLAPKEELGRVIISWSKELLTIMTEHAGYDLRGVIPELIKLFLENFRSVLKSGSRTYFPCTNEIATQLLNAGQQSPRSSHIMMRLWFKSGETILLDIPDPHWTAQNVIDHILGAIGISPEAGPLFHLHLIGTKGKETKDQTYTCDLPRTELSFKLPEDYSTAPGTINGSGLPEDKAFLHMSSNSDFVNVPFLRQKEHSKIYKRFESQFGFTNNMVQGSNFVSQDEQGTACKPFALVGDTVHRTRTLDNGDVILDFLGYCETIETSRINPDFSMHISLESSVALIFDRENEDEVRFKFNETLWDIISGRYNLEMTDVDAVSLAAVALVAKLGPLSSITQHIRNKTNQDDVDIESILWKQININLFVPKPKIEAVKADTKIVISCIKGLQRATKHEARLLYWDFCVSKFFLFGARMFTLDNIEIEKVFGNRGREIAGDTKSNVMAISKSGIILIDVASGSISYKFTYAHITFYEVDGNVLRFQHKILDQKEAQSRSFSLKGQGLGHAFTLLDMYWKNSNLKEGPG